MAIEKKHFLHPGQTAQFNTCSCRNGLELSGGDPRPSSGKQSSSKCDFQGRTVCKATNRCTQHAQNKKFKEKEVRKMTKLFAKIMAFFMAVIAFFSGLTGHRTEPINPGEIPDIGEVRDVDLESLPNIGPGVTATSLSRYTDSSGKVAYIPVEHHQVQLRELISFEEAKQLSKNMPKDMNELQKREVEYVMERGM